MFKRLISLLLVISMIFTAVLAFSACDEWNSGNEEKETSKKAHNAFENIETDPPEKDIGVFKLGVIVLQDEYSAYDNAFIKDVYEAANELELKDTQLIIKKHITESNECYEAAVDLVELGCDVIFANSFGHESYILKAAKEYPNVEFCVAGGMMAGAEKLDNFHNAYAAIYEGRFLSGVAAGLKLNEMISSGKITADQAVMGYVGAFTYAEVISAYTAFYLGAKLVCPSVKMKVMFANTWFDASKEKSTAQALIASGCVLISQHSDTMGAPTACEEKGVPNVAYNGNNASKCPNTFILSSAIDWTPYFKYICEKTVNGEKMPADWTGTLADGSVVLSEINTKVAASGTEEQLNQIKEQLNAGTLHVFDVIKSDYITVDGKVITSYIADVVHDSFFTPDTEVVSLGYFHESEMRSAPYFDIRIDGIELINQAY